MKQIACALLGVALIASGAVAYVAAQEPPPKAEKKVKPGAKTAPKKQPPKADAKGKPGDKAGTKGKAGEPKAQ